MNIIYKTRTIPKRIIGNYALLQRLDPRHEKIAFILEDYKNRKAGFGGEKYFDKQLTEFKPQYPHAILHDVCLKQDGSYFQMDSILITPESIIIFEVKNFAGKIVVTQNPQQFIKVNPTDQRKVIKNPITELDRKEFHLTNWLQQRGFNLPIEKIVVFAYLNEFQIENTIDATVLFTYEVVNHLRSIAIKKENLTKKQIHNLAIQLKSCHEEYNPFPMLKTLGIQQNELLTGVICTNCKYQNMIWNRVHFRCTRCNHTKTLLESAIFSDWMSLIGNTITNKQFREFSLLPSSSVAKRMLKHPLLTKLDKGKSTYYEINPTLLNQDETLHNL